MHAPLQNVMHPELQNVSIHYYKIENTVPRTIIKYIVLPLDFNHYNHMHFDFAKTTRSYSNISTSTL